MMRELISSAWGEISWCSVLSCIQEICIYIFGVPNVDNTWNVLSSWAWKSLPPDGAFSVWPCQATPPSTQVSPRSGYSSCSSHCSSRLACHVDRSQAYTSYTIISVAALSRLQWGHLSSLVKEGQVHCLEPRRRGEDQSNQDRLERGPRTQILLQKELTLQA